MADTNSPREGRRLDKALRYVSDYHLPLNKNLIEKIEQNIEQDVYIELPERLFPDLCSDLGLFSACLRELNRRLSAELPEASSPLERFASAEMSLLREILRDLRVNTQPHVLSQGSEEQLQLGVEGQISRSASECLAESMQLDPAAAGMAALLKDLGRALIAWNYPDIYSECLVKAAEHGQRSLEQCLLERLGFSPAMLATRMLTEWGISLEYGFEIGLVRAEDMQVAEHVAGTYASIVEIGEALARSNFPSAYPQARASWKFAREAISGLIGSDGLEKITERFAINAESLAEAVPEVFRGGLVLDPVAKIMESTGYSNPYVRQCSEPLRSSLVDFYDGAIGAASAEDRLRDLRERLLDSRAFRGGIVYTVDPLEQLFVPQSAFGEVALRSKYKQISYDEEGEDLVLLAFRSVEPVFFMSSDDSLGIASMFGQSQRVGVLYLEAHRSSPHLETDFRAMLFALRDLFGLR